MTHPRRFLPVLLIVALAACGQHSATTAFVPQSGGFSASQRFAAKQTVKHVVIIIQENRSVDNLFNGLPGADTVTYGTNGKGEQIPLVPEPLNAPYDISHRHSAWSVEYDNAKLDGWNLVHTHCQRKHHCPSPQRRAYGYVPQSETKPYFTMAESYGFADRMFQTNEGPSFPAHQYLLSGTSTIEQNSPIRAAENPLTPNHHWTGGCDSPRGSLVYVIDTQGNENQEIYPCFNRIALTNLIEKRSLTWRYYGVHSGAGLWNAPDAILQIRRSSLWATDDRTPPSAVLKDIEKGDLANVVWVTPTGPDSDHAGWNNGDGPSWVTAVVNAIGESPFWRDTVIFVVWDDWGGWFDHVAPPVYNSYELGFRVPLIVISPYVKQGYISHKQHEFGSILKFVEKNFGLGSLGTTDVRSDDLSDFFDYRQRARKFVPITAPLKASHFLHEPVSSEPPDDDY